LLAVQAGDRARLDLGQLVSETPTDRLKVSREGIVLIKSFEGFRPRAVQEESGAWVIGYGHTASAREGLTVAEADAELLLQYDLLPVVKALNAQVRGRLNQHQFDALASFAVSVGVERFLSSDVLQKLNDGHPFEAADALIGWPENFAAGARLRRRAAERALFVADPRAPVTLADLLAAPLPPASDETRSESRDDNPRGDARAAAVAALLGEPLTTPEGTAPGPDAPPAVAAGLDHAQPDVTDRTETTDLADSSSVAGSSVADALTFSGPAFEPASAPTRIVSDRYSPYAVAIIGPLPGFEVQPAETPAQSPPMIPAEAGPAAFAVEIAGSTPTTLAVETTEPAAVPFVAPLLSAPPMASPFPASDQELVLTPATEADFAETERPVWPSDDRATPPVDENVLFDEEPRLSVLRHEIEPAGPRRFDWSETGAFLIMGVVGLAACGASAAAFRLAVEQPSPMGETSVIAWALALIGVICVGVSSWNLYVRWGKPD
jgi:lysozyme